MASIFIKISGLSCLLLFPLLLFSQSNNELLQRAETQFPKDDIVLTESYVHYNFKVPKANQEPVVEEMRKEQYLSLKGGESFSYVVTYDENSFIKNFESDEKVYDKAYQSDDIFHSDLRVKYTYIRTKQRGNAAKVEATKVYEDLKYLTSVYLTSPQSCLKRTIEFTIPEGYDVELVPVNFTNVNVTVTEETKRNNRIIRYTVENIKGYAKNGSMPGMSHIYPHILILAKQYKDGNQEHTYFNSLDALYGWYRTLVLEIENKPDELKSLVDELTADAETDEQKIKNIYYWVQDNIRYIAFEDGIAGYQPENCQTVLFNRYGDCKGMANLTKEMLILAGFDARLVWLGTKSVATTYATPSLAADNHMICAVKMGEEFIFLDGTEKHTLLGFYAERIQNQEVLIEDGDSYIHTKIPAQDHLKNTSVYTMDITLEEDNILKSKTVMSERGEAKSTILYLYTRTKTNEKQNALERYFCSNEDHIAVEDFKDLKLDRDNDELLLEGTMFIKNKVSAYDNELYIYLDPYRIFESYTVDEDREHDLWMPYKLDDQVKISFAIPKGHKVSSIPAPVSVKGKTFSIEASYTEQEGKLAYVVHILVPNADIGANEFKDWNTGIKALRAFYEEPIVLIKS